MKRCRPSEAGTRARSPDSNSNGNSTHSKLKIL